MRKKKRISGYERFMAMSPEERARDVAKFDREFIIDEAIEPPPEAKAVMDKFIARLKKETRRGRRRDA
jgi:hypothetical protein